MKQPIAPESPLPALYMVLSHGPSSNHQNSERPESPGYDVFALPAEQIDLARPLIELDGALTDPQWRDFTLSAVPDGVFIARESRTGQWVGTVSAVHNPQGGRFYFPGGGALGYLVVDPRHRGHALGLSLVRTARDRLLRAGYRHVWLGVEDWRTPAIRTYLIAGFVPFLHAPDPEALSVRWIRVFQELGRSANPAEWPRKLPTLD